MIDAAPDLRRVTSVRRICEYDYQMDGADIALLNLQVSIGSTADLITRLHRRGHAVVVLSPSEAQNELFSSIEAGARGYLSQQIGESELLKAVRTVASGRSYFSTSFKNQSPPVHSGHITERERQVLVLVANGATDREIASKLNISEHTVHSHLDRLGRKTGSRRRADLIRLALEQDMAGQALDGG
ncbi:LuxR C-terminal-related transcriptional regulator [Streptomyces sp. NPDC096152]|uniref:LuxR C-terminal-related transcriptional regulator n=1 Tax=Streptomyces sp. NPDC096152 TaxID=3366078 RepID=UPI00380BB652